MRKSADEMHNSADYILNGAEDMRISADEMRKDEDDVHNGVDNMRNRAHHKRLQLYNFHDCQGLSWSKTKICKLVRMCKDPRDSIQGNGVSGVRMTGTHVTK